MDVYVCWDGDKIGRRVGRAVLANDVGEVRRVDQAINAGNELWRNFANNVGGSVIEIGGDEGRIVVDASRLAEVPGVAQRYSQTVGATVSVGVGMKLAESAQALVIAKLRGGNKIVVWDADTMGPEYQAAVSAPKTEQDKLQDEYLAKADGPKPPKQQSAGGYAVADTMAHNTKENHGSNAGFAVQHKPGFTDRKSEPGPGPDPGAPDAPAPAPGAGSSDGGDFEDQLHDAAGAQGDKDQSDADASEQGMDDIKKKVADSLKNVRKQLPLIAQLQQRSPEAYKAIVGLVQGVILLGKQVMGPQPPPDEEPQHVKEALAKSGDLQSSPPADGEMGLSEDDLDKGEFDPEHHVGELASAGHTFVHQKHKVGAAFKLAHAAKEAGHNIIWSSGKHTGPSGKTHQGWNFRLHKSDGLPEREHAKLPVGSRKNGSVKVRHDDGKEGWKQVHAGQVQAQDPGSPVHGAHSHPVSSREPSGK